MLPMRQHSLRLLFLALLHASRFGVVTAEETPNLGAPLLTTSTNRVEQHTHNHVHDHDHDRQLSLQSMHSDCGTHVPPEDEVVRLTEAHQKWQRSNVGRMSSLAQEVIRIPTYFHILRGPNVGSLNRSIITDMFMPKLNKGFQSTPFKFVLKGIDKTVDMELYMCNRTIFPDKKKQLRIGGDNAMNVYVCNTLAEEQNGWATYPSATFNALPYDGVHIMNPQVADDDVTFYQTLIHETGHWLSLLHTFEPYDAADCQSPPEYSGCDSRIVKDPDGRFKSFLVRGDGVADTPAQAKWGYCYSGYKSCFRNLASPLNTCPDDQSNVDPGNDPVDNYMVRTDLIAECATEACLTSVSSSLLHAVLRQNYMLGICREKYGEFTPGQVERMVAAYETFRDPTRGFNCGCASCTATVLQRSVMIPWIDSVNPVTCNDGFQELISKYGYSPYRACEYIGKNFWKQCGRCHPSTCRYIPTPRVCAAAILKTKCPCLGGRPRRRCVRRNVRQTCNFGSQTPSKSYVDTVWTSAMKQCRRRST